MIRGSIAYNRWVAQNTGSTSPGWVATVESQNITVRQNIASLRVERENVSLSNALLIPGLQTPLSELRSLLFGQGQQGGIWMPSLSPAMISGNTFGSGVQTFLDLSGRGNNATQATSGFRPAWGRVPKTGRRNLLTNSAFVNTIVGADATAPTGWFRGSIPTAIAAYDPATETITFTTTASDRFYIQQGFTLGVGETRLFSVIVSLPAPTRFADVVWTSNDPAANTSRTARINGSNVSGNDIIAAGLHTFELLFTSTTGTWTTNLRIGAGVTGAVALTATFRQPQLEAGTTRSIYQRVGATAFDITETGQRDCYYVQPDGSDDSMATGSINFSGTDKVTVFAAVRKLSDAAAGVLAELTVNANSTDGGFFLATPTSVAANIGFTSRGTTTVSLAPTGLTAPINLVITGESNISAPLSRLRVNGTVAASSTSSLGTGNFANDVFYLFRRAGSSFPANVQCFGLIVAGGAYSLSTIQRVERILSRYTPTVNL